MKKKRLIAVFFIAALMISMLSFPAAAYANGSANIYDSMGTRLGFVDMWTNNATTGRILYAQTTANANYNYIAGQSLIRGMTRFTRVYLESEVEYNENAQYSPVAAVNIPDNVTPVDARCIGAINTYVVGLCRRFNDGTGNGVCSQGDSCEFPITLENED